MSRAFRTVLGRSPGLENGNGGGFSQVIGGVVIILAAVDTLDEAKANGVLASVSGRALLQTVLEGALGALLVVCHRDDSKLDVELVRVLVLVHILLELGLAPLLDLSDIRKLDIISLVKVQLKPIRISACRWLGMASQARETRDLCQASSFRLG